MYVPGNSLRASPIGYQGKLAKSSGDPCKHREKKPNATLPPITAPAPNQTPTRPPIAQHEQHRHQHRLQHANTDTTTNPTKKHDQHQHQQSKLHPERSKPIPSNNPKPNATTTTLITPIPRTPKSLATPPTPISPPTLKVEVGHWPKISSAPQTPDTHARTHLDRVSVEGVHLHARRAGANALRGHVVLFALCSMFHVYGGGVRRGVDRDGAAGVNATDERVLEKPAV